MFGSKVLALIRKDFQFRDILILLKAGKTDDLALDCKDVHSLLQKFRSYGRCKVIADLMHFTSQNLFIL